MIVDTEQVIAAPWVLVNVPARTDFLIDLRTRLAEGRGFRIATLNLDHAVKLRRDVRFRAAYGAHTHVTADGRPIVWLAALAGRRVDLITGSDLVEPLAELCAALHVPVAFLGSTEEVLDRAADRLMASHSSLKITARLTPPMGFDPEGACAELMVTALRESGAGLCLLALGAPKQERFAAFAAPRLPKMGFVSIGAGLDFVAGAQRRAPRLIRRLALEWLWRLISDPRRLAWRYGECFAMLPILTGHALSMRLGAWTGKAE